MNFFLNATGFALLIVVFLLFRGVIRRSRRRSAAKLYAALSRPPVAQARQCPRCSTSMAQGAAYCPQCGLAQPPPLPRYPGYSARRPVLAYVIFGLLAILGMAAYWFVQTAKPKPSESPASPFGRPVLRHPNDW